jgi:hypothetical protein
MLEDGWAGLWNVQLVVELPLWVLFRLEGLWIRRVVDGGGVFYGVVELGFVPPCFHLLQETDREVLGGSIHCDDRLVFYSIEFLRKSCVLWGLDFVMNLYFRRNHVDDRLAFRTSLLAEF